MNVIDYLIWALWPWKEATVTLLLKNQHLSAGNICIYTKHC